MTNASRIAGLSILQKCTLSGKQFYWANTLIYGSPFPPHAQLPVDQIHFERWLSLFAETLNELFSGEVAKEAIWRANKMAIMFQYKIEHYRNNATKSLI